MFRYKMTLAYDGTFYHGWQKQPNASSIQETVETTLKQILQKPTHVIGAGRTDAYVHARGQVAHFSFDKSLSSPPLKKSLNALLPPDIRILSLEEVDPHFHARFSAKGKIYRYTIVTTPTIMPLERLYALHYTFDIDLERLKSAIPFFLGEKNYRTFANEANRGSALYAPIKTLYEITFEPTISGFSLLFRGNGFLYKMVRNIVGTLLDIGRGKIPLDALSSLFTKEDRRLVGKAIEPQGLCLEKVLYD